MTPANLFDPLHALLPAEAERLARLAGQGRTVTCVSACLLGVRCRYDGGSRPLEGVADHLRARLLFPLCPEVLAGLGTPRPPMQFEGGDGAAALAGEAALTTEAGLDRTAELRRGVQLALRLALAAGCQEALLKERSPSCGVHQVHDHARGLIPGQGMFAAALRQRGVAIRSEQDLSG